MLLHIYCTKVLVVKLYYSTYICQLRSGDSNQISKKGFKKGAKGQMRDLEGSLFCFTGQNMATLVWLRAAMLSSVPGVEFYLHTSHSILLPLFILKRWIEWALKSKTGRGIRILTSRVTLILIVSLMPNSLILMHLSQFWWSNTKESFPKASLCSL